MTERRHHAPSHAASVRDNRGEHRYEIAIDGHVAFLDYERSPGEIRLLHTEVPPELQGRGLATQLVKHAIDAAHAEKRLVISRCSVVDNYMAKHGI